MFKTYIKATDQVISIGHSREEATQRAADYYSTTDDGYELVGTAKDAVQLLCTTTEI